MLICNSFGLCRIIIFVTVQIYGTKLDLEIQLKLLICKQGQAPRFFAGLLKNFTYKPGWQLVKNP